MNIIKNIHFDVLKATNVALFIGGLLALYTNYIEFNFNSVLIGSGMLIVSYWVLQIQLREKNNTSVTRLEVIENGKRKYVKRNKTMIESHQDGGRTLKVFVSDKDDKD